MLVPASVPQTPSPTKASASQRPVSVSIPETTPAPHFDLFAKRDQQTCGNLNNAYPNAVAPVCMGTASICTFSNGNQGCCDSSGSCQFFTECLEAYATQSCQDSSCLRCTGTAIYCTTYLFTNAGDNFSAYSCGQLDLSGLIIRGGVSTNQVASSSTILSNSTTTASSSGTSTMPSSSSSSSSTPAAPSPTATSSASSHSSVGKIAGGTVGGVAGAAILIFLLWWCLSGRHRAGQDRRRDHWELQQ